VKPLLPERAAASVLVIGQAGQRLFQRLHEPTQTPQPIAKDFDSLFVFGVVVDPRFEASRVVPVQRLGGIDGDPTVKDVLRRPILRVVGVKSAKDMKVVIHDGEPCDGDGEVLGEQF
jgi:hypothetical protein